MSIVRQDRSVLKRCNRPDFANCRTTFAHVEGLCPSWPGCPTNDQTPTRRNVGRQVQRLPWRGYFPVATNFPRSAFLNRDSFPFVLISLRIEE